ncbi:MAG TPA: M56 family metallopeptidase [bacterium]|nr:M56 family metallopeptidase [bacterium]HPN45583.1 M56 family metallopeptidase [bacterium]
MNLINNIAHLWWQWMGAMLWQASLLVIVISLLDYFLFKHVWPPVRYAVWILVLVKLFIPPDWSLATAIVPKIQPLVQKQIAEKWLAPSSETSIQNTTADMAAPAATDAKAEPGQGIPSLPFSNIAAAAPVAAAPVWQVYAMFAWLLGMLIFAALLLGKIAQLCKWHLMQQERENIPVWFHEILTRTAARLNLDKLPAIVYSDKAVTPAVYGLFNPVLLLPLHYFDTLTEQEAEHVLLHELAHLKRGDLWINALCLLAQIVYWFNPLLVWARKQLRHIGELCCDMTVANILKEKTTHYRQTLLNTARVMLTESLDPGMGLLGVFEEPFRLVNRLKWLEKNTWKDRKLMIVIAAMVFIFMAGFILPMGSQGKQAKSAAEQTEQLTDKEPGTPLAENAEKDASWWDKLKSKKSGNWDYNFFLKETEEFYAVVLPMQGPLDQVYDAMHRLQDYCREHRIQPNGPSFLRQLSQNSIAEPEYAPVWEVGYPVAKKISVSAPFELKNFPAENSVCCRLDQSLEEDSWNRQMANYLYNENLVATDAAFIYCPDQLYDHNDWRPKWEVQIPVQKSEKPFPTVPLYTKWTEEMVALVLPVQGSYDQEASALAKLRAYLKEINVEPQGEPFFRYFNNKEFIPEEEVLWEVGFPVPKGTAAVAPFEIKYFPEELVICTEFKYDYKELLLYVHSMALSYNINGYRDTGYPMRIFKSGDVHGEQVNEFRIAVRKAHYNVTQLPRF